MAFISFRDWLARESSPATRLRWASALGLMPPIPAASIHAHSTAIPWQVEPLDKTQKKHKKKKKRKKKVDESKHYSHKDPRVEKFVTAVDALKNDVELLKKVMKGKKSKAKKVEPKKPLPTKKTKPDKGADKKDNKTPGDEKNDYKDVKKDDKPQDDEKKDYKGGFGKFVKDKEKEERPKVQKKLDFDSK
jgi:hypothetical protein